MRCWITKTVVTAVAAFVVITNIPTRADQPTTIRGRVIFKGDASKYKPTPIDRSADPACAREVKTAETESLILNRDTKPVTIRNSLVFIKHGLEERAFHVSDERGILFLYGCQFKPHVLALQEGQPLWILNADATEHRVHLLSKVNEEQRFVMPKKDLDIGKTVTLRAERPFEIKSDNHPWMTGYIGVFHHPFFDVTGKTGYFDLRGMPPGKYVIEAWHETLGSVTAKVDVLKGEKHTLDLVFEPKAK